MKIVNLIWRVGTALLEIAVVLIGVYSFSIGTVADTLCAVFFLMLAIYLRIHAWQDQWRTNIRQNEITVARLDVTRGIDDGFFVNGGDPRLGRGRDNEPMIPFGVPRDYP